MAATEDVLVDILDLLRASLISEAEHDQKGDYANVVDGLFAIAAAIDRLADTMKKAD